MFSLPPLLIIVFDAADTIRHMYWVRGLLLSLREKEKLCCCDDASSVVNSRRRHGSDTGHQGDAVKGIELTMSNVLVKIDTRGLPDIILYGIES